MHFDHEFVHFRVELSFFSFHYQEFNFTVRSLEGLMHGFGPLMGLCSLGGF